MIIKRPDNKHKIFRIMKRVEGRYITQRLPQLDSINASYLKGDYTFNRALQAITELKSSLPEVKHVWLPENESLVAEYWNHIRPQKFRREPKAALDRIKWAVRQLGATNLITATREQLEQATRHLSAKQQKRAVQVYNSILVYKQINRVLPSPEVELPEPQYITLAELKLVVAGISKPAERLFCLAAYATGARYGEVLALERRKLQPDLSHIYIDEQRKRGWITAPPKNKKKGHAFIIKELREAVVEWVDVSVETKQAMRATGDPLDNFKQACSKALHRDLTLHNLRHSYAKHMLAEGASLNDLREWMRDSLSTIEMYYAGWEQSSSQMESNKRRFG